MMVEHDEECIRAADYLIDIGPGGRGAWGAGGMRGGDAGGVGEYEEHDD